MTVYYSFINILRVHMDVNGCVFFHFLLSSFTDTVTFLISQVVGARHPLAMDPDLDYEVDSDEEWEEVFF